MKKASAVRDSLENFRFWRMASSSTLIMADVQFPQEYGMIRKFVGNVNAEQVQNIYKTLQTAKS